MQHQIELLAPARTADIGIEAFRHGADAVYIGAPAFSARAAAGNTIGDVERLANYGHQYSAKTIVAFNTILTDRELPEAEKMIGQLYETGVDALIIQDFGLLQLDLPPIALHASTQTDNRTIEKVRLLRQMGMRRVVMARELSIDEIKAIHEAVPDVELECFVHGALCVCISGQCYMSAALNGRSANRGSCSQPCRLPMDLLTADGTRTLATGKHLLSLRDMNRSAYIEQLVDAGVTSLKIEGRLKEMGYVKNVVGYYRRIIDEILLRRSDLCKASEGEVKLAFEPKLEKSFNRGFTPYFADGIRRPMWNFESPKSMGEKVGTIARVGKDCFTFDPLPHVALNNGDGLATGAIGFRLNRYDADVRRGFPLDGMKVCKMLRPGQTLYRNLDIQFEQLLAKPNTAQRVIPIAMEYVATSESLTLTLTCNGVQSVTTMSGTFDAANRSQEENVRKQLAKLGDTIYRAATIEARGCDYFVPSSKLGDLRRRAVEDLDTLRKKMLTEHRNALPATDYPTRLKTVSARDILPTDYLANVMNEKARKSMRDMGVENVADAFETQTTKQGLVMQTRHCLKYAYGQCPRYTNPAPEKMLSEHEKIGQELQLKIDGRKFLLKFGCKNDCVCKIFTIFAPQ